MEPIRGSRIQWIRRIVPPRFAALAGYEDLARVHLEAAALHGQLRVARRPESVVYLYFFQSWCPGCHSHGFPTMAAVRNQMAGRDVAFVAVQTVFEGHEVNTADRAVASVAQHGLSGIPVGHDVDPDGGPPSMMVRYRTGGTPWTVIIGPERRVCFDGFQIDEATAVAIIGQLLG